MNFSPASAIQSAAGCPISERARLTAQYSLLFHSHWDAGSATRKVLNGLIDENADLMAELQQKQDHLESLGVKEPKVDMVDDVERLQDENIELKHSLEAKQALSQIVSVYEKRGRSGGLPRGPAR